MSMKVAGEAGVVQALLESKEPAIRYRTRVRLLGEDPNGSAIRKLREEIRTCARARMLMSELGEDGTVPLDCYNAKFRGSHWVMAMLAEIDYPEGDQSLLPMVRQTRAWALHYAEHMKTINGRVRRCASQEGHALHYLLKLGFYDATCDELAQRLVKWQWPGGGWNCDTRPEATHASFNESLVPLRGLIAYAAATGDQRAKAAAAQAAEMFLERRLFRRKSTGEIIRPLWIKIAYPLYYQYSFFLALRVMAEGGFVKDPRSGEALDLLESKRLSNGGFPRETSQSGTGETIKQRRGRGRTLVEWGPEDGRSMNEWVTAEALYILKAAGRG